jgi:hypothetical protein
LKCFAVENEKNVALLGAESKYFLDALSGFHLSK